MSESTPYQENSHHEGNTLPPQEETSSPSTTNRFIAVARPLGDFLACEIEKPKSLLGEVFPEGALGVFYGKPGLGKTWLGVELALSVACGVQWHGLQTTAARTMYLSLELQNWAIQKRLQALTSHVLGMCVTEEVLPNSVRLNFCVAAELSAATVRDGRSTPFHWPTR